ncbi:hypothetical protein L486_06461 [Kwoniella mangroviensis CBS 10435]|uniref:Magnesium transporter NIPA-domain-containing protein n=1 Tax=Kwoniella mangroviensis CBS 10435 TaxID=1331196 RepID=A0A1B9IK20_9TREE|nr:uncharacterized protein I203_05158 [Kwoniella mangroviensis CBS 8507]OCF55710.1 hypothetical protein L486_06461 [Kwoniella mangroviensis CBS 10435]OCF65483.1 hypothetical protein I203_05158 [Kwoniella mangroviensis CBS 8507]
MDEITATPTLDDIISATSTLLDIISTSTADNSIGIGFDYPNGTSPFDVFDNSTISDPDIGTISDSEGNYVLNTFIGLLIVLVASVFNALGLNMTKLDHVRQQNIPKRQRKKEWMRILWLSGMGMYIASQVFGSPLALRYLRPDWVAPLGSSSLVFNFLFAYWLVGTPVTPTDIHGTIIIILGVILIIIFSSINHGLTQSLNIERLNSLWSRASWLAYFLFIVLFTASTYLVSSLFASLLASRASFSPLPSPTLELPTSRPKSTNAIKSFFKRISKTVKGIENIAVRRLEAFFARTDDARLTWLQGMGWAVTGGSLAGLCLVFTKAAVKLFGLPGHPLVHPSAIITLLLVIITAVLQIVCLDRALKCADTVVVVPLFYAGYTVFGFINSLIFYNETGQYARWVLVAVFISIAVLISGVVLLSLKSSAKAAPDPYTVSAQPSNSMRLRPRNHARTQSGVTDAESGPSSSKYEGDDIDALSDGVVEPRDVLWEVGSVSDASDDELKENEKGKGKGVGGMRGGTGERRGLLGDEEEDIHEGEHERDRIQGGTADDQDDRKREDPFVDDGDGDDGFGEYEGVEHEDVHETKSGETTPRKSSR